MAFEIKNVEKKYTKFSECKKGDVIAEGHYEVVGKDNYGGLSHEFRNKDDGLIYVVNSAGHINFLLNKYAAIGDYCRVVYDGKVTLEKGRMKGKEYHQFILEIDDEKFDEKLSSKSTSKEESEVEKNSTDVDEDMSL